MSTQTRPLTRFAVALALAAVFVGARVGVQMFAAPMVTFDTLPELRFNQGQTVTVAFAAQGFPTGVTYTAEGLPPGLSMSMGVDTLGHVVGILGGTLAPDTPEASGSEGVYSVRIHASDGAVSNFFPIDVSHWNQGDVFVGGGQWVYQVYREDASFKTDVTVPDDPNSTYGSTTGCAVNWRTGEVWATNFDDVYPALNVITRHAGSNPLPYTDPSRRLSTERYGSGNTLTPFPGNLNPFDINPESVAFNNAGEMLVGHSFGYFNDDGNVARADGVPTVLDDPIGGWVYVDAAGQPLLDIAGNMIPNNASISPAGFFEKWIPGAPPFNVLGQNGQPLAVPLQGGMDLHRYIPDANGNYNTADRQFYDLHYGYTGIDTLDLLSDQTTVNYTSEDWYIHRYDIGASAQLPVVGSAVVGESKPISTRALYGLRALPPGDGTGGYLVVNEYHIDRLDRNGNIVQSYDVRGDADYPDNPSQGYSAGDVNGWFAIAIAPGGRTFWAATRQDVFHFDLASGQTIGPKIHATAGTLHTNAELAGLCVMDEYRAAQEVCGPTGLGNGIDDDHDGTIDEGCFRVEICSAFSPGDDDGDGLIDYNDPDCGAPPAQQCVPDGPTDNSVAGVCDRADYEGDTVVVPGIPLPCVFCDAWTFSYTATGLPDGLTMNPATGEVTGMPYYSIVNPNSETSPPVVFTVTVNSTWQREGAPAATFSKTFNWTIYNRNRVPVAVDDGVQTVNAGGTFSFDVRANDGDIDGDAPLTIVSFTQPPSGQGSVVQAGQNLVYTAPASGFSGVTSFTYTIKDTYNPAGVSNVATVRVRVNNLPLAADDSYVTLKNTPLSASVTGNDTPSIDGGNVWTVTAGPASGVVALAPTGTFVYTPALNFTGTVTFNYNVCDIDNDCAAAVATIKINDVPVAVNDSFVTALNTPITSSVTGNDTPSADGGNVWTKVTDPSHGTVTVTGVGGFTYTPNLNYSGLDSFTYKVCDVDNDCSTATVTIRINDVPKAVNDSYTTPKNTPLAGSVTGNDTPSLDTPNSWSVTAPPASGVLSFLPNGTFTYTPALNFTGTVTFTYKVCDVDNDCATAIATIKINDVPVAVDDSFTTALNTPVNASVTGNDTPSADGGNVWTKVTNPSHGTVSVTAAGGFTYTPALNYSGLDSFTYKVCDVDSDCSTATVTIRINDVPKAVNDSYTTPKNTPLVGSVTANDTASIDAPNTWSVTTPPASGVLSFLPNGTFTYTPALNFTGTVTFNYKVCDVDNDCATAVATIKINDVPLAVNDSYTTPKNTALTSSVAGNDTPSADGGNTWTMTVPPASGTVVLNPNGTFTYTPVTGFAGTVTFTYKVCDVDNDCATAIATIKINDVPLAVNDSYTTAMNTPLTASVAGNDTPSADAPNTWTMTVPPASGTVVLNPNGTFTYTPVTGFTGTVTFTYKVCDIDNDCATAVATIRINDVPLAVNDSYTTPKNTPLSASVAGNDTPSADGGNTWTMTVPPASGTVVLNPNGTFTYTPVTGFAGTVTFTYKVCDVDNDCATAIATIKINDVPLAVDDSYTTRMNMPLTASVAGNDTPSADAPNTWTMTVPPASGTVVLNPNGTFTYTPVTGFTGTVTFTYKVCDVDNDCATAVATIRINDVPVAVNDSYTTPVNTPVSGAAQSNDTASADGGNVWSIVTAPTSGTVVFGPTGAFTYTPATNFTGTVSFTYRVCDIDGDCASAIVTILIQNVCEPGAFTTFTQGGWGSKPKGSNPGALLAANFADVYPGGSVKIGSSTKYLQFTSATAVMNFLPAGGTASTISATATNPTSSAAGVFAGQVLALQLNVDFSEAGVNKSGLKNQVVASGKLAGYSVGQVLALANAALAGGTLPSGVSISDINGVVDAINNNYDNGTTDMHFLNDDPSCGTVNHVPNAVDDAFTTSQGVTLTGSVIANDSSSADGGNVWSLVSQAAHGVVTVASSGAFIYVPSASYYGADSFVYRLCDVDGDCDAATVSITITSSATNRPPVAVNDAYATLVNTPVAITVLGNDSDPDADPLTVVSNTAPSHGSVVRSGNTFVYTPASNYVGTDAYTYTISDGRGGTATATVSITISSVASNALATGDTATIGYWKNRNGQALIKKMNGSASATNLGNWLAATYPYLFGAQAGTANNMAGKTNTQVAAYDAALFTSDKWMAQVLGGALAAYVTNSTLAGGNYSVAYGFNYSATGTGAKTYNIGANGTAIGLSNNTSVTVSALLQQANLRKQQGTYDSNAFNVIFSGINETGDIR